MYRKMDLKVDKTIKASDGWVKRRENERAGVEKFYGYESNQLRKFEESIETHKQMNKTKLRFVKNI